MSAETPFTGAQPGPRSPLRRMWIAYGRRRPSAQTGRVDVLEFWPDYGSGPLWSHGAVVSPGDVAVDPSLAERLIRWNAEYTEDKIPLDGPGDQDG